MFQMNGIEAQVGTVDVWKVAYSSRCLQSRSRPVGAPRDGRYQREVLQVLLRGPLAGSRHRGCKGTVQAITSVKITMLNGGGEGDI